MRDRDADRFDDVVALLAAALEPIEPPAAVRARLLEAAEGRARYLPFARRMQDLFDLTEPALRRLLERASDPAQWTRGLAPVLAYLDFTPGRACVPLRAGLVRMQGGVRVPRHRHTNREVTLVLEGCVASDGKWCGPGESVVMPAGSEHVFEVGPNGAMFAVLKGAIELLG